MALNAAFPLMVLCGLVCVGALAVRFHRAGGIERQQLKWLLFAAAITVMVISLGEVVSRLWLLPLVPAVPVAAGVAILRYRLYDIDRIISRTLVYGLLSVLLGAVYAGVVLLLGQVFGGVAGRPPSWAVAGATLAVAALFQPARRHIQAAVDRRFNRRKYDAAKTVEAFSARLRDEVDLDTLSAELLAVVDQTMQPTRSSLWLRPSAELPASSGGRAGKVCRTI
jgi:4-amino-4-deoxy-L-arabinose transferase-like glycosyltransferase